LNRRTFLRGLAALIAAPSALELLVRPRTEPEWPTWVGELTTSTSLHELKTGRFEGWKVRRSNYGVFIDGTVKPYRISVIDHRTNRFRDVTELLPRLR
jgi:hypothetical protein